MTEKQMFRAIVRGLGVYWALNGVEQYWFLLDRVVLRFPELPYKFSRPHDFLDASINIVLGYLLTMKSGWIIRFVYPGEDQT